MYSVKKVNWDNHNIYVVYVVYGIGLPAYTLIFPVQITDHVDQMSDINWSAQGQQGHTEVRVWFSWSR